MKNPVLSIVVPTYNASGDLERFFTSLAKQTLSKDAFEICIVDGGSTDSTLTIARKYGAIIIHNPHKLAEPGVVLGFEKARGELVMVMATDNVYKEPEALEKLVNIFKDSSIVAAFPKHETAPDDSLYSRYFNTFTDPFTHFVYGDSANARTFKYAYKTKESNDIFDIYDYGASPTMPIIALAQGFTIRKREAMLRSEKFDDVLIVYRLIEKGKRIAFAHGISLFHYTVPSLSQFITKQKRAVENALLRGNSGITKRGSVLTHGQKVRMYLYFPYAFSFIFPLLVSLIKAIQTKTPIWLIHSYIVFLSALVILLTAVPLIVRKHRGEYN